MFGKQQQKKVNSYQTQLIKYDLSYTYFLQIAMKEESIHFFINLFHKWIEEKQKDYPNLAYEKYYEQIITKHIKLYYKKQGIEVTFDLRAADAIQKIIKQPKMIHFGQQERYLNKKRLLYLQITEILFDKKFIDKRHYLTIKDQILNQENNLLKRLQNFIDFHKVCGKDRLQQNWRLSMKMSFLQFWQTIKINQFFFSPLVQIFEITRYCLSGYNLKLADQCITEVMKRQSRVQAKQKRQKYKNHLDSTFINQGISIIMKEDKSEEMFVQRKLLQCFYQ